MRYHVSSLHCLVLTALAWATFATGGSFALGQEMHEFFNNTHESPGAVDYGAAYYTRTRSPDYNQRYVVPAAPTPRRQASLGTVYGDLSVVSWLGRRPSGIAYLGVQLDRRSTANATVSQVEPDSPAAQAGLQPGDVIRAVNGRAVNSINDLPQQIGRLTPGDKVQLAVERFVASSAH